MFELVIACLVLALLEMDTTYLGQFLFSRPACTGAIMGFICGDFFIGLQLGIFTELLFIDFAPIGGVVPPSGAICSGIAVMLAAYFGMPAHISFFIGLLASLAFTRVEKRLRKYRSVILPRIEKYLINGLLFEADPNQEIQTNQLQTNAGEENQTPIMLSPIKLIMQSFFMEYLVVFFFVLVITALLGPVFFHFKDFIPPTLDVAFSFSYFLVPWIGLSMLFISFSTKQESK